MIINASYEMDIAIESLEDARVEGEWNKEVIVEIERSGERDEVHVRRYRSAVVVGTPGAFVKLDPANASGVVKRLIGDAVVVGVKERRYVFDASGSFDDPDAARSAIESHLDGLGPGDAYREALVTFRADEGLTKHDVRIETSGGAPRCVLHYARTFWIPSDVPAVCRVDFDEVRDALLYFQTVLKTLDGVGPVEIQLGRETKTAILAPKMPVVV